MTGAWIDIEECIAVTASAPVFFGLLGSTRKMEKASGSGIPVDRGAGGRIKKMYKLTPSQLELQKPGHCTRCGDLSDSRNTAGQCCACHNLQYYERKAAEKAAGEASKAAGRDYWASRDIIIGERLITCLSSVFCPAGEIVYGLAAVGVNGAYVKCCGKKCIPEIFNKIKMEVTK